MHVPSGKDEQRSGLVPRQPGHVRPVTGQQADTKATGQPTELDPELASWVLAVARRILPAEPRGGEVPFGPVIPAPPDAGGCAQLAAWLGRQP